MSYTKYVNVFIVIAALNFQKRFPKFPEIDYQNIFLWQVVDSSDVVLQVRHG